ncbi:MAG TPA: host attachment protein [Ramlibacter sp.]|nr:host attachment protein [Ramlibacter sp.]
MKPHWILLANAAYARVLQQNDGESPVIIQGFTHSLGRSNEVHRFAHELAEHLDRHAQLGDFDSLAIFASAPFLGELEARLGAATQSRLLGTHEVDLTSVGPAELQRRIAYELAR